MALNSTFSTIQLDELLGLAKAKHDAGYRFVQTLCRLVDENVVDIIYTFMAPASGGFALENYTIENFNTQTQTVPSVGDYYLSSFPFENEAHDLFGVTVTGMPLDFDGNFYAVSMDKPMTVISPEQKAAREKAAKLAAAKAAKAAKEKAAAQAPEAPVAPSAADGEQAPAAQPQAAPAKAAASEEDMEAKLAAMNPEKAAKVRAALAAKAAKQKAAEEKAKQDALEEKLAGMDPEKAAKVRAAMEAKAAREAAQAKGGE